MQRIEEAPVTLANEATAPKPARVAKEQAEIALKAAAGGRWSSKRRDRRTSLSATPSATALRWRR